MFLGEVLELQVVKLWVGPLCQSMCKRFPKFLILLLDQLISTLNVLQIIIYFSVLEKLFLDVCVLKNRILL
jgi:hypothetical protein